MWSGFKSRRRRHMWVEFVVGSLPCSERFFSGYSGFPLSSKTNISKFQFDQESGKRRTTMWMCYLQIVIYLFILFIFRNWQLAILKNINNVVRNTKEKTEKFYVFYSFVDIIPSKRLLIAHVRFIKILIWLSAHFSKFFLVFVLLKSLLGTTRQWVREMCAILTRSLGVMLER